MDLPNFSLLSRVLDPSWSLEYFHVMRLGVWNFSGIAILELSKLFKDSMTAIQTI